MAAGGFFSPTASSAVSTSSEEPDEDLRRAHNRLSLRLEKDITPDQLRELKQYFYKAPLDAKIHEKIASFIELWNALDSYRTIKPGKYTHLKSALSTIGAQTCLATTKKFEIKEFKSRERAISRDSAKQRELETLVLESADLRKQVERERQLKDEAEKLRDLAIRERELSRARHETAISEAWREIEEKKHHQDYDHQTEKEANDQGIWRVVGPAGAMEAQDDVEVFRFDESQQETRRRLEDQCQIRTQTEKLEDLARMEGKLSHIQHEEAARSTTGVEQERRTHAERQREELRNTLEEEDRKESADLRTVNGRINSNGTPTGQKNYQGFREVPGSNHDEREANGYRTGHQVEGKSRSRSESDTDKGKTRENRASGRQRFVAASWDETMSDRRPSAVQQSGPMIRNMGADQLYQWEDARKGIADWRKTDSFEPREGDEDWEWLSSVEKQRKTRNSLKGRRSAGERQNYSCETTSGKNIEVCTNSTSNVVCDRDLDDILGKVVHCIDTKDLPQMRKIMEELDADSRKTVTSLKVSHQTAVFRACVKGHVEFVEYLLSKCGATTEEIGEYISEGGMCYQATPLWWASYTNQPKMVQTLIIHGAYVNAELTAINSTPVLSACAIGNVEIVKYLAAHGADLQKPNASGETCLHKSVQSLDLCLFLLNHGADVNRVDGFGRTPLHHAVDTGPVEVVRLLARRGADVKLRDCCGDTALEIAWRKGREKVAELLLKVMELKRVSGRGARQ